MLKVFGCYESCGTRLVVCAGRSKEEAYGVMVNKCDRLKYFFNLQDFFEIQELSYYGDEPKLIIGEDE